jgi:hypothetical protein
VSLVMLRSGLEVLSAAGIFLTVRKRDGSDVI